MSFIAKIEQQKIQIGGMCSESNTTMNKKKTLESSQLIIHLHLHSSPIFDTKELFLLSTIQQLLLIKYEPEQIKPISNECYNKELAHCIYSYIARIDIY